MWRLLPEGCAAWGKPCGPFLSQSTPPHPSLRRAGEVRLDPHGGHFVWLSPWRSQWRSQFNSQACRRRAFHRTWALHAPPPAPEPIGMRDQGPGGCLSPQSSCRRAWSHERSRTGKCEWLTPPEIIRALGRFDLDPCAPRQRPWPTARRHFTIEDDGLCKAWFGRVWLNPPYGRETNRWLAKLARHGDGIALIFARTETRMFFDHIWARASAVLFLRGRLTFHNADGTKPTNSGGAPSCLVAYGRRNAVALATCGLPGKLISLSVPDSNSIPTTNHDLTHECTR